jgi:pimeloyl-ACP methyl ester carboxylesterase
MSAYSIEPARRVTFDIASASGDGRVAGIEFGDPARPLDVIFLHANGFNALTYRSILAPLASEMRILAVDLRGHGRTGLPADPEGRTNWLCFRDDLLGLLDALGDPKPIMSGHSMGGCTSLLTASIAPERIRTMVFFDPVIMPRTMQLGPGDTPDSPLLEGARRRRARFDSKEAVIAAYTGRGAFRTWTPQMLADYVEDGFKRSSEGGVELTCAPMWEAANFASHMHDPWPALDHYQGGIRMFRAETGTTARIDDDLGALVASGRVRTETVPGTSHFLPMERPDLVHSALREAVGR